MTSDRLKVTQSFGRITRMQASALATMTVAQGSASTLFAAGTRYTLYTVHLVGPHAHQMTMGTVSVSDNDGNLTKPADLYYLAFARGPRHPDPFAGDMAPYNATTVGQSSQFTVAFVRGRAQFAVVDAQAGSGPITITISDSALGQSQAIRYPDTAVVAPPTSVATQTLWEYQGSPIPTTGLAVTPNTPVALTIVNANATGMPVAVTASAGLTIDLSTTAPNVEWTSQPSGAAVTSVEIPAGSTTATVYLTSTVAQTILPNELSAVVPQVAAQAITAAETASGARVQWAAPATGNPVNYQVWEINETTGVKTDLDAMVSGSATSYAVTNLTPGDSYAFNVDAVNAYGTIAYGQPTAAFEYGTSVSAVQPTTFAANSATSAGTVTFLLTMDKSLPAQNPVASNFTIEDTTTGLDYTVTNVTVSGADVMMTARIPMGTPVLSTDTVQISGIQGALVDAAGAPSATFQETTTN